MPKLVSVFCYKPIYFKCIKSERSKTKKNAQWNSVFNILITAHTQKMTYVVTTTINRLRRCFLRFSVIIFLSFLWELDCGVFCLIFHHITFHMRHNFCHLRDRMKTKKKQQLHFFISDNKYLFKEIHATLQHLYHWQKFLVLFFSFVSLNEFCFSLCNCIARFSCDLELNGALPQPSTINIDSSALITVIFGAHVFAVFHSIFPVVRIHNDICCCFCCCWLAISKYRISFLTPVKRLHVQAFLTVRETRPKKLKWMKKKEVNCICTTITW